MTTLNVKLIDCINKRQNHCILNFKEIMDSGNWRMIDHHLLGQTSHFNLDSYQAMNEVKEILREWSGGLCNIQLCLLEKHKFTVLHTLQLRDAVIAYYPENESRLAIVLACDAYLSHIR